MRQIRGDYAFDRRPGMDQPSYGQGYGPGEQVGQQQRGRGRPRGGRRGPFAGLGPRNYQPSDEQLEDAICSAFMQDEWLDPTDVDVVVTEGIIILDGEVDDRDQRRRAEDLAGSVGGENNVRNDIKVNPLGRVNERDSGMGRRLGNLLRRTSLATRTMERTVMGVFRDMSGAERALNELRDAGFARDDVSFVTKDRSGTRPEEARGTAGAETKGLTSGALIGALGGGALGWLLGIGALPIPGIGPVLAGGALATALAGAAAGAVAGGLVGTLAGLGVPESEAREYEQAIKEGGVLVTVRSGNDREVERARDILRRAGAEQVDDFRGDRRHIHDAGAEERSAGGRTGDGQTQREGERQREAVSG